MSQETPTRDPDDVRRRLHVTLPAWRYERGWIRREWKGEGWPGTLLSAAAVAHLAEAAFHHPDLLLGPDGGTVKLRHHFAAGITDLDLELATEIEALLEWPGEEAPSRHPPPRERKVPGEGPG